MLLNKKAVKEYTLQMAKSLRPFHPFERVGSDFILRIDAAVRRAVAAEIKQHPSKGKTLQ
jgi:hypothetical protein